MKKKIFSFLYGELFSSVIFIILGILMCVFPAEMIRVITKVIFGIVLMVTGCFHLYSYLKESKETTVLDMFTGVIVLLLGIFFFRYPQVVVKMLSGLLGAMLVVDCVWVFRAAKRLRKLEVELWKTYLFASLLFLILGLGLMWNPFSKVVQMVVVAGILFVVNGVADIVFYVYYHKMLKAQQKTTGEEAAAEEEVPKEKKSGEEYEEYDPSYAASYTHEEEEIIDGVVISPETQGEPEGTVPSLPDNSESKLEEWIS
ncbi:MAG: DUF308 domain-containing protein [Eubacteriales bacterium]|nr:DUF308 domain-containing protein [Eubacteriales bacterium]